MFVYTMRLNVRNQKMALKSSKPPLFLGWGKPLLVLRVFLLPSVKVITASRGLFPFPSVHLCCVCILTSHMTCGCSQKRHIGLQPGRCYGHPSRKTWQNASHLEQMGDQVHLKFPSIRINTRTPIELKIHHHPALRP